MANDLPTARARVVSFAEFAAVRARRGAEQLTLFEAPAELTYRPRSPRPVTARGIEHRHRMLRHLATART